jgi:hypothetical protein
VRLAPVVGRQRGHPDACSASEAIQEEVPGDPVEPTLEGALPVPVEVAVEPHEHVLCQIARLVGVAGQRVGHAVDGRGVVLGDLLPGRCRHRADRRGVPVAVVGGDDGRGRSDDMADMDHGDMGMMDDAEMEELRELEGDEFDRRFMEAMIVHHEGAIDMAERVLAEGRTTRSPASPSSSSTRNRPRSSRCSSGSRSGTSPDRAGCPAPAAPGRSASGLDEMLTQNHAEA